ncbi:uncharacterized protein LOC109203258 isoform X2 [Oreochromis niloticus]|uniref:uncharacterized protein LOC109203258 isoform X2 n=1 Tax=Oreochromis niloticus TaxID=8128 RepID=UPI000DF1CD34|nr:uncharacterized protein LOC109203258 isoform X2 [Oreochromis niloticus]
MLLKVKYQSSKKYIRLQPGFTYLEFISEVKNKFGLPDVTELHIFDETDTAANPDICLTVCDSAAGDAHSTSSSLTDTMSLSSSDSDLHRDLGIPVTGSRLSTGAKNKPTTEVSESEAAKEMVENALRIKPGGEDVLEEYKSEKSLQHRTRRQLVNILASHMTEMHGRIPSRKQKEKYALGIITLFPSLKDPFSPKGYEHFYDGEKGTGYLAWRLKTMSRSRDRRPEKVATSPQAQGPNRRRSTVTVPQQLDGDACREAVSFLLHCNDETVIFEKMKMTFQHRQNLVHDPQRTTDVLKTSGNSIGLNSMQTLCLVRNLPLIFGDLLPEGNPNWTLLLLLLQIINIIFSPSLTLGMTIHLKHLIIEHHVLFKQLYPNRNLIPKHHFMIHYPSCIRKIGPLIHMWSMRFEAKHKVFKNTVKNFKNVTKSLARKHQIFIGYHWETSPLNHIEYGPLKSFNLDREDNTQMFARALHAAPRDLFSSSWIKFSGTEYRKGLIICINVENEMPVFGRITTILLADSTTFFLVDKLLVDNLNEHFHAYRVFETDEKDVIKADNLIIYKPFDLQHAHTGVDCLYVVPLFYL